MGPTLGNTKAAARARAAAVTQSMRRWGKRPANYSLVKNDRERASTLGEIVYPTSVDTSTSTNTLHSGSGRRSGKGYKRRRLFLNAFARHETRLRAPKFMNSRWQMKICAQANPCGKHSNKNKAYAFSTARHA
jgi:hypothetical protein